QEQVAPGGQLDRRRQLQQVVLEAGAEAASVEVDRQLRDRPPVQVAALGLGDRNPLGQVVQQLDRLVMIDQRRVAENTCVVDGKRRGGTDSAIHGVRWRPPLFSRCSG